MDGKCLAINGAAIVLGAYVGYTFAPKHKQAAAAAGAVGGFALAAFALGCKPWEQESASPDGPPVLPGGEPSTAPSPSPETQRVDVMPQTDRPESGGQIKMPPGSQTDTQIRQPAELQPVDARRMLPGGQLIDQLRVPSQPMQVQPLVPLTYNNLSVPVVAPKKPDGSPLTALAIKARNLITFGLTGKVVQMPQDKFANEKQAIEQQRIACRNGCDNEHGQWNPNSWLCKDECDKVASKALQELVSPGSTAKATQTWDPACVANCQKNFAGQPIEFVYCKYSCPKVDVRASTVVGRIFRAFTNRTGSKSTSAVGPASSASVPSAPPAKSEGSSTASPVPLARSLTPTKPVVTTASSTALPPQSSGVFRLLASPSVELVQPAKPMMGW